LQIELVFLEKDWNESSVTQLLAILGH